ncbi:MAG: PQQ-binding-like beta-propeller repeat protein, partial [Alicyclobacillus sp.]|nr:PQQ-binding-like beta-propeller repeat protein [Alicyclobacillus sp.]
IPPKGQGWLKGGKFQGGGAVWMPAAIDPDTGILYFGVGNPAPDFYGKDRPGANKYTDSVVALDAKTGKLIWARQEVSHDLWDYDAASSPMVLTATVHGKKEKVVVEGGKDGQWYAWDAKTGKVIYNGVPFVTIKHPAPTPQGVLEYPGALGGENYAPETYDPGSNYALIPGVEDPMLIIAAKNDADVAKNNQTPGAVDFGTTMGNPPGNITPSGTITAIDLNTGKKVYQIKTDTPMRGGFTSTASGIAFYGDGYGYLNAMDVKTGQILWSFQTGAPIGSAPAIYQIGGKEYVAISVGGAPTGSNSNASKVEVFALGGSHAQFPPPGSVTSANGHGSTSQSGSSSAGASSFAATKGHWLALDKQSKTVDLLLIAGYNGALGGMNFNGYGNGQMKVTVPLGWKVNVKLENASGQMPHSAMIVPLSTKGTVSNFKVAFPNATTPDPLQGLAPNGQPQSFSFTANKAGTFLIWCGVPGHGVAGMYDTLVVDAKATAPSITLPGKGTTVLK